MRSSSRDTRQPVVALLLTDHCRNFQRRYFKTFNPRMFLISSFLLFTKHCQCEFGVRRSIVEKSVLRCTHCGIDLCNGTTTTVLDSNFFRHVIGGKNVIEEFFPRNLDFW